MTVHLCEKPEWIPCITSKLKIDKNEDFSKNKKHLLSMRPGFSFVKAQELTIVDCFTFGLKLNRQINPIKHYFWYIDFVRDLSTARALIQDVVFIAPDADWLGIGVDKIVAEQWVKKVDQKIIDCLVVPGTFVFNLVKKPRGYAIRPNQKVIHPEWTHSFSRNFDSTPKPTKSWTYDSIIPR